jgi:hypothetical protein
MSHVHINPYPEFYYTLYCTKKMLDLKTLNLTVLSYRLIFVIDTVTSPNFTHLWVDFIKLPLFLLMMNKPLHRRLRIGRNKEH